MNTHGLVITQLFYHVTLLLRFHQELPQSTENLSKNIRVVISRGFWEGSCSFI